jgi:hypothetical protein
MQIKLTKALNEIEHNEIAHNEIAHNEIAHNEIAHNETKDNEIVQNETKYNEMKTTNKVLPEIVDEPKCNKIKEQLKSISIDYKEWDSTQWLTGC